MACQYLDPLWGSVGDWLPFGGVGMRFCEIPGSLLWVLLSQIPFRGSSFRAWVGAGDSSGDGWALLDPCISTSAGHASP